MADKVDYRMTRPSGNCAECTINLWAEHDNGPAPNAMPCPMPGCKYKSSVKLLAYGKSSTGSPIALITG